MRRFRNIALGAAALILVSPLFAPQLLAFPHRAQSEIGTVWSERPIDEAAFARVAGETRDLLAASPIASGSETRPIFLTDGGWRWLWLANTSKGGFALTRAVTRSVIVNDNDLAAGRVRNGREIGGERSLSAVLAHEFTHGILRRRYGIAAMFAQPTWKVEGYADHVAQESSLSDAQAAQLRERGESHPALIYYDSRRLVADALAASGNDVDALFAGGD